MSHQVCLAAIASHFNGKHLHLARNDVGSADGMAFKVDALTIDDEVVDATLQALCTPGQIETCHVKLTSVLPSLESQKKKLI